MTISADPTIHRQVVAAARSLLVSEPGASIGRIASDAGVSRATFYRHFGSRDALLAAVEMEPPAPARDRILETAADLLGRGGLHGFTMEHLAVAAGVSRATVYRLFPSKAALFGEIVRAFSPFEPAMAVMREHGDRPPDEVVPMLVRTFAEVGARRIGVMRGVLLEASALDRDAMAGVQPFMPEAIGTLAGYMARQMDAGTVRRMHPVLAVQALLGPVFVHLLTRPIAERLVGFDLPMEDAISQLTSSILAGLRR
ncbi:MAG TPA: helix-turn-helix domain-containing protein [Candidatus Limnocylindria bacterium]|nr:helix-turn-helix domain-containing protein [Candidatus Limnocylindria bacterium]